MPLYTNYMIRYVLDGVAKHFCVTASQLNDSDAIRLASRHASDSSNNFIALGTSRELAQLRAEKVGITKVRWNLAE